jgi:hypothetical protein
MAIVEVDILQGKSRAPIVPTYKRPEYLARIVRLLNDYYLQMAEVEEWEQEVWALRDEYRLLERCRIDIYSQTPLRLSAGYGTERVQGSPSGDPHIQTISRWNREYEEISKAQQELLVRANSLERECKNVRQRWFRFTQALSKLTNMQRDVIEARHKHGVKIITLARGLHYERSSISCVYARALHRLVHLL